MRSAASIPCLVVVLGVAGVAGCQAPSPEGVRTDAVEEQRKGQLDFDLDQRAYRDRPFELLLPPGTYETLTLYELDEAGERERKLQLSEGDQRLTGKPSPRVQLLFPSAERKAPPAGRFLVVVTDDRGGVHELVFSLVERSK